MKEFFRQWFGQKDREISNKAPPFFVPHEENNPLDLFQLRIQELQSQALARHHEGGTPHLQQTKIELVAQEFRKVRNRFSMEYKVLTDLLGLSVDDYKLAEEGILEPEKVFSVLPTWTSFFSHFIEDTEGQFLANLETQAQKIVNKDSSTVQ